jgi:hypothetical protein
MQRASAFFLCCEDAENISVWPWPLGTYRKKLLKRPLFETRYDSGGTQKKSRDCQGDDDAMHDSLSLRGDPKHATKVTIQPCPRG